MNNKRRGFFVALLALPAGAVAAARSVAEKQAIAENGAEEIAKQIVFREKVTVFTADTGKIILGDRRLSDPDLGDGYYLDPKCFIKRGKKR